MTPLAKQRTIIVTMTVLAIGPLVAALAEGYGTTLSRTLVGAVLAGLVVAAVISTFRGRTGAGGDHDDEP